MKDRRLLVYSLLIIPLFLLFTKTVNNLFTRENHKPQKISTEKAISIPKEKKDKFVEKLLSDFSLQYKLFKEAKEKNGKYIYSKGNYTITFTVEPKFQKKVKDLFKRYKLRYGAYVAIDGETGKVLAAVSSLDYPDLTFKNTFPTASTFKIVTAAAALEEGIATPETTLICGGTGDSCSPTVWLTSFYKVKRRFDLSFATSANPFFGNLARLLGKEKVLLYAKKFGFNRKDYEFPWGIIREPLDDNQLALLGAGLGESRSSPFHEALISLTIENKGVMLKPTLIEEVKENGKTVYSFKPEVLAKVVSLKTAEEIRKMMLLTTKIGTVSDKKFFRVLKRRYPHVVVGGKSGTLSEKTYPEGRCEWFTGFAEFGNKKIAFASLGINQSRYYITGYDFSALAILSYVKLYREYFALKGR